MRRAGDREEPGATHQRGHSRRRGRRAPRTPRTAHRPRRAPCRAARTDHVGHDRKREQVPVREGRQCARRRAPETRREAPSAVATTSRRRPAQALRRSNRSRKKEQATPRQPRPRCSFRRDAIARRGCPAACEERPSAAPFMKSRMLTNWTARSEMTVRSLGCLGMGSGCRRRAPDSSFRQARARAWSLARLRPHRERQLVLGERQRGDATLLTLCVARTAPLEGLRIFTTVGATHREACSPRNKSAFTPRPTTFAAVCFCPFFPTGPPGRCRRPKRSLALGAAATASPRSDGARHPPASRAGSDALDLHHAPVVPSTRIAPSSEKASREREPTPASWDRVLLVATCITCTCPSAGRRHFAPSAVGQRRTHGSTCPTELACSRNQSATTMLAR